MAQYKAKAGAILLCPEQRTALPPGTILEEGSPAYLLNAKRGALEPVGKPAPAPTPDDDGDGGDE